MAAYNRMPFRNHLYMALVTHKILCIVLLPPYAAGFLVTHVAMQQPHEEYYLKREHTLVKPYQAAGAMSIPLWDFKGSTMVTSKYVRLTPDRQSKQGAIWNSVPCAMASWEMQLQFHVHGSGTELYGDGMAIWYTRDRMQLGPVFGSKDYPSGLAIFLDTYNNHNGPHNHNHPYLSAMVGNGSQHYNHDLDGTHTEIAGCEVPFRGVDYDTKLAIRYQGDRLTVSSDVEGRNAWRQCFSVAGVHLPTGYYFGISAATGELADNHDVISVKVFQLPDDDDAESVDPATKRNIVPSAEHRSPHREHSSDRAASTLGRTVWRGLKLFVIVFISIAAILSLVGLAYYLFKKHNEGSRSRFY